MPSLRDILVMNWRAPLVPVYILDSRLAFVCPCFRVRGTNYPGMGPPYQHLYGSHGSIYHDLGEEEESENDCAVVSSSGDGISARSQVPSQFRNSHKSSRREIRAAREHPYADQATQTPQSCSKSSHMCSALTPSAYSTSPSAIATSLNTTHVENRTLYKTQKSDSTEPFSRLDSLNSCTRTDSAIELHTFIPVHSCRYPPGIVVIRRLDEQGNEVVEETDVAHQNTRLNGLKPTLVARVECTGVVQTTKRAGLIERAWERIADALAKDDG